MKNTQENKMIKSSYEEAIKCFRKGDNQKAKELLLFCVENYNDITSSIFLGACRIQTKIISKF